MPCMKGHRIELRHMKGYCKSTMSLTEVLREGHRQVSGRPLAGLAGFQIRLHVTIPPSFSCLGCLDCDTLFTRYLQVIVLLDLLRELTLLPYSPNIFSLLLPFIYPILPSQPHRPYQFLLHLPSAFGSEHIASTKRFAIWRDSRGYRPSRVSELAQTLQALGLVTLDVSIGGFTRSTSSATLFCCTFSDSVVDNISTLSQSFQ